MCVYSRDVQLFWVSSPIKSEHGSRPGCGRAKARKVRGELARVRGRAAGLGAGGAAPPHLRPRDSLGNDDEDEGGGAPPPDGAPAGGLLILRRLKTVRR